MTTNNKEEILEKVWQELVTLDYVLTWHYTNDYEKDLKRYKKLSRLYSLWEQTKKK